MGHMVHVASVDYHMDYSCGLLVHGKNRQAEPESFNLDIKKLWPEWLVEL